MLTDIEIQELVKFPKKITQRVPARGYKQEDGNQRCDLTLESIGALTGGKGEFFTVFIRQNGQFIENYSVGLRYDTKSHIHRITAEELASGSSQPQESHREITDKYNTLEECLKVFFYDTEVTNGSDYFPGLEVNQRSLLDGHQ